MDEEITQNVAGLVYDQKGNMRIGIIYTRMNIGGYLFLSPILTCIIELFETRTSSCFLFFSYFVTLFEDAASKSSSTTSTETPIPV